MTTSTILIACHECDLLHKFKSSAGEGVVKCRRCHAVLLKHKPHNLEFTLALTVTGLILFVLANTFPILSFKYEGQTTETILLTGVNKLIDQDYWLLAILVFLTSIAAPLLQLIAMLYVFMPLYFNRVSDQMALVFRLIHVLHPWAMLEVFMLGILVSVVKLAAMATIVPGVALWSFAILIFVLAATANGLNPELVWEKLGHSK